MGTVVIPYVAFERLVADIDRHIGQEWASGVDPDRIIVNLTDLGDDIKVGLIVLPE